jgi:hypothetical protein
MKMIAAMQARSGTVRGAPPRAWEGGRGQQGLDALPQLIGQQAVGERGHGREGSPDQPPRAARLDFGAATDSKGRRAGRGP